MENQKCKAKRNWLHTWIVGDFKASPNLGFLCRGSHSKACSILGCILRSLCSETTRCCETSGAFGDLHIAQTAGLI